MAIGARQRGKEAPIPDYTVKNLKEVEDQAPNFGMPDGIQARFARRPLQFEKAGASLFTLAPNFRVPFGHKHSEQEEVYVVVRGSARAKVGDEILELGELDALRVGPGVMRQFEAGPDGVEYVAFGTPQTGPDEVEMVPGWWSD